MEWRQLTPERTRRALPAPVWEDIAAQLTRLNQPHMAAFILILLVTYIRPSEFLALRKVDLAPPVVPLAPCSSVVIAASETGVSTKTLVRDRSVLHGPTLASWVNKLLPQLKAVNPVERIWNFDHPAAAKMFNTATDYLELSGMTMCQTRHSGASIDRVRGFRTLHEVRKTRSMESFQQRRKIRRAAVIWHLTATPSLSRFEASWKHSRDVPMHCWWDGCEFSSSPADDMLDVFGGLGFLAKRRIIRVCVAMCSTRSLDPGET